MSAYDAIARDLSFGASGWVDEARLVGNVTARQIIMLCRHTLDQTKHVKKLEAENAALRAQIPKVVKPKETDKILFGLPYSYFACKCGCVVVTSYCYCPECCARLDWSEVAP